MRLLPALKMMQARLADQTKRWDSIVKIGRTHLQDATPLTLGQEFSGYATQVGAAEPELERRHAAGLAVAVPAEAPAMSAAKPSISSPIASRVSWPW